ncbi:MAG: helix-turn-helix domain-containing protein [Burkholderiaceae bacterium]
MPDRVAYWTDLVCDTYVGLNCDPGAGRADIQGEILVDRLAALDLSRVTATAQRVCRTPARISAAHEDFFLVSIQTVGHGRVLQDGRCAALGPGDYALYDSTRPYELQFDGDFQQFVLMLPRAALQSVVRNTESLTASTMSGQRGAGPLMINMIRTLADTIRNARLDACRRALADPTQALRSISEIAFAFGFNDAAHFSRSFRARFDCSPREFRARRGAG